MFIDIVNILIPLSPSIARIHCLSSKECSVTVISILSGTTHVPIDIATILSLLPCHHTYTIVITHYHCHPLSQSFVNTHGIGITTPLSSPKCYLPFSHPLSLQLIVITTHCHTSYTIHRDKYHNCPDTLIVTVIVTLYILYPNIHFVITNQSYNQVVTSHLSFPPFFPYSIHTYSCILVCSLSCLPNRYCYIPIVTCTIVLCPL